MAFPSEGTRLVYSTTTSAPLATSSTYRFSVDDCQNVIMTRLPCSNISLIDALTIYNSQSAKYTPKKIIFNGPATIVFWKDGTKTIVKRAEKDPDNRYNAFCAALAKKIFKSNSKVNSIVKNGIEEK